ncbi:hypothetical protein M8818_000657 [Zalaria obscura]|uniref:Uncharacterized protein n=1 Tax=Zalaria obscura TaxID=2024903 RepID=A0ACC3SLV6_9PEZI
MSATLRPPTVSSQPAPPEYEAPSLSFLHGTWHVTHSTLPMWKSKRNVRISYTPLPPSTPSVSAEHTDRLDDIVTYQGLSGTKVHEVHGVDKASSESRDSWDWRGKGWLMIASSHWEVLGWGQEQATQDGKPNNWAVTYFAKTLFTPAGIDIYSSSESGLQEETVLSIKRALTEIYDEGVKKLAGEILEIKRDGGRTD